MWCDYCDVHIDNNNTTDVGICTTCHSCLDYCEYCDGKVLGDGSHCVCFDCRSCTKCKVCLQMGNTTSFYIFTDICTSCLKKTCYKCKLKRSSNDVGILCPDCALSYTREPLMHIFPIEIARMIGSYDNTIERCLKRNRDELYGCAFKIDYELNRVLKDIQ